MPADESTIRLEGSMRQQLLVCCSVLALICGSVEATRQRSPIVKLTETRWDDLRIALADLQWEKDGLAITVDVGFTTPNNSWVLKGIGDAEVTFYNPNGVLCKTVVGCLELPDTFIRDSVSSSLIRFSVPVPDGATEFTVSMIRPQLVTQRFPIPAPTR
jgi:hypothetical protein